MTKEIIKPLGWGMVIGAIGLLIVIFWTGWAITSSTAEAEARQMAKEVVLEKLVPICVAQYLKDPHKIEKFAELKGKAYYLRDDYVKESGWSIMPGSKSSVRGLDDKCAQQIIDLEKKKSN
jgi:hypothetical protein